MQLAMPHCLFELSHEKTNISPIRKQMHRSASQLLTAKLISAFVFATRIVQFLLFLNLNFTASSHLLCLYSLVCVEPVRKPQCLLSHDVSHLFYHLVGLVKCQTKSHDTYMSHDARKPVFRVSDKVLHKPVRAVSEEL